MVLLVLRALLVVPDQRVRLVQMGLKVLPGQPGQLELLDLQAQLGRLVLTVPQDPPELRGLPDRLVLAEQTGRLDLPVRLDQRGRLVLLEAQELPVRLDQLAHLDQRVRRGLLVPLVLVLRALRGHLGAQEQPDLLGHRDPQDQQVQLL